MEAVGLALGTQLSADSHCVVRTQLWSDCLCPGKPPPPPPHPAIPFTIYSHLCILILRILEVKDATNPVHTASDTRSSWSAVVGISLLNFRIGYFRLAGQFCLQGAAKGSLTVGDTVLFLTIMQQLYGPLNYFGTYYR